MSAALRLFFALPCSPLLARELDHWRARQHLPGRAVQRHNLHLTLAFLGAQPAERLEPLKALGERLPDEPFELCLDRLHLARRGLLWIEPSAPPPALLRLAEALREQLGAAAFAFDAQPFRPHVTLIRDGARALDLEPPRFEWRAERIALYLSEHIEGAIHYRPLWEKSLAAY